MERTGARGGRGKYPFPFVYRYCCYYFMLHYFCLLFSCHSYFVLHFFSSYVQLSIKSLTRSLLFDGKGDRGGERCKEEGVTIFLILTILTHHYYFKLHCFCLVFNYQLHLLTRSLLFVVEGGSGEDGRAGRKG